MHVVIFCHSVRSDWHHSYAHFVRGIARELQRRGHDVSLYEPAGGWSASHLMASYGPRALNAYRDVYPTLIPELYDEATIDLDEALQDADLVLVHEWTHPRLIARLGRMRIRGGGFTLLFHDTRHRARNRADGLSGLDLSGYDAVLARGEVIRERYLRAGWTRRVWTWHEAADIHVFHPHSTGSVQRADLIWIGNWRGGMRERELFEYLLAPAAALRLTGRVHGIHYSDAGISAVRTAGLVYAGWLANHDLPYAFGRHRVTVHVPQRLQTELLPGVPAIRMYEALACGIPLICAPWDDAEGLFTAGADYLLAHNGAQMTRGLYEVLSDADFADALAQAGMAAIAARHTCAHRVDELMAMLRTLAMPALRHELAS